MLASLNYRIVQYPSRVLPALCVTIIKVQLIMLKVKVIYQLNYYIELACFGLRLKFLLIKTQTHKSRRMREWG